MSSWPFGPFRRIGTILQQVTIIANSAGHHSVINIPRTDDWYIAYHLRPLDDKDCHHRLAAIEHLYFNVDGIIKPMFLTMQGVAPRTIPSGSWNSWTVRAAPTRVSDAASIIDTRYCAEIALMDEPRPSAQCAVFSSK